ncbi:MAG: CDP-glucose 4,6-dehydratase [Thermoleophilaceae bacterium]
MPTTFWQGKTVLVTGHTGFKGAWLSLWLERLGARVVGYAPAVPAGPSLYEAARVGAGITHVEGDIRDLAALRALFESHRPDVVFHLAAQSLVRRSYRSPLETYDINVMGTVALLEAARQAGTARVIVNVTSDKCYENREWVWPYREHEPMGGRDPYSSSKGCAELVTAAFRTSFFDRDGVRLATARAGNVVGGGDWAEDRLVPDLMRAALEGRALEVRNPSAVRPWQHVLNALSGYLRLAERAWEDASLADGWNFGPPATDDQSVAWIVERLCSEWGEGLGWEERPVQDAHEARVLRLDSSKARALLGWSPAWMLDDALGRIVEWYRAFRDGEDMRAATLGQIEAFEGALRRLEPAGERT